MGNVSIYEAMCDFWKVAVLKLVQKCNLNGKVSSQWLSNGHFLGVFEGSKNCSLFYTVSYVADVNMGNVSLYEGMCDFWKSGCNKICSV